MMMKSRKKCGMTMIIKKNRQQVSRIARRNVSPVEEIITLNSLHQSTINYLTKTNYIYIKARTFEITIICCTTYDEVRI